MMLTMIAANARVELQNGSGVADEEMLQMRAVNT
jgi:hypothetical protein